MFIGGARGFPSKGPAPRPAPRPSYTPPPSVPIRTLVNPVTPYRRPAPPAYHPPPSVPIRRLVNPVTPYRPPARSTVNTTGSPAHATTQRLAKAIGQPRPQMTPARLTLNHLLQKAYAGRDRAFMLPVDPITHGNNARIITGKLEAMGQFKQDFQNLSQAGLLPKGAKEPPLVFPTHGANGTRTDSRSYEHNGKVFLSPIERSLAGAPQQPGYYENWAKQTLVHELAHTLQSKKTLSSVPSREGGAQAFTDAVAPRVLGPVPTNLDSNYTGYVNKARKRGNRWVMQGQFQ